MTVPPGARGGKWGGREEERVQQPTRCPAQRWRWQRAGGAGLSPEPSPASPRAAGGHGTCIFNFSN